MFLQICQHNIFTHFPVSYNDCYKPLVILVMVVVSMRIAGHNYHNIINQA